MDQATIARIPWYPPKVRVLDWPVLSGSLQAFRIIIKDGVENTFRSKPIVTVTTRKFDALRLVKAIVDHVEFRSFTLYRSERVCRGGDASH